MTSTLDGLKTRGAAVLFPDVHCLQSSWRHAKTGKDVGSFLPYLQLQRIAQNNRVADSDTCMEIPPPLTDFQIVFNFLDGDKVKTYVVDYPNFEEHVKHKRFDNKPISFFADPVFYVEIVRASKVDVQFRWVKSSLQMLKTIGITGSHGIYSIHTS